VTLPKTLQPTFREPIREPEIFEEDTGFEFEPDPDMALEAEMRPGKSPFRPDWERARMEFEPDGADCG